jgi:Tol biopolymer transport system component
MKIKSVARIAGILFAAPAFAQVTTRVSVSSTGEQGNNHSDASSISADGRFVAFGSLATNLGGGSVSDGIYVRDRWLRTTELVVPTTGSTPVSMSADGRYVVFEEADGPNHLTQVWVRDRQTATTLPVSVTSSGAGANDRSGGTSISADGRFVTFFSFATNLVPGDTNGVCDVFVRDLQAQTTERVSVSTGGAQGNATSSLCAISGDGRYVAFQSSAQTLVASDTNGKWDVFLRDRDLGTTELVSVDSSGIQANGDCDYPSISSDGRHVSFWSAATNLVPGGTTHRQIFVRDRATHATELVSQSTSGVPGDGIEDFVRDTPSMSPNGRYVAFMSMARNLIDGQTPSGTYGHVFLRDRQNATTELIDQRSNGAYGDMGSGSVSMTPDGRLVSFDSGSTNLVAGDTNGKNDVFVRDRSSGATIFCSPGVAGVRACPCSNPPGGPGLGCDNSAVTGGAAIVSSGVAYLSSDSLAFTTWGETDDALSMLVQGSAEISAGAVFGHGVGCAGGVLRTLATKTAIFGSITAPDFVAGDPSVSARSAALGDTIQPGQSRWYFVAYRDPLGVCPSQFLAQPRQAFNATPTGRVSWGP